MSDIAAWSDAVINASEGTGADRLALLTDVVERFGIDPARFETID